MSSRTKLLSLIGLIAILFGASLLFRSGEHAVDEPELQVSTVRDTDAADLSAPPSDVEAESETSASGQAPVETPPPAETSNEHARKTENRETDEHEVIEAVPPRKVCGRAVDELGKPVQRAVIWIHPVEVDRMEVKTAKQTLSSDEGEFCLDVPVEGEWLAIGMHEDFQVATQRIPKVSGASERELRIEFKRGASFEARVTLNGKPMVRTKVVAWNDTERGTHVAGDSVRWRGGGIARITSARFTDSEGVARFAGLSAGSYEVLAWTPEGRRLGVFALVTKEGAKQVELPRDSRVSFAIEAALVEVSLPAEKYFHTQVEVRHEGLTRKHVSVNDEGHRKLYVSPNETYSLRATAGPCLSEEVFFKAPGAGETAQVTLACNGGEPTRGTLKFRVSCNDAHVSSVYCRRRQYVGTAGSGTESLRELDAENEFTVSYLHAGDYTIELTPHGRYSNAEPALAPLKFELKLVEAESRELTAHFELGGALRVRVANSEGDGIQASCKIYDLSEPDAPEVKRFLRVEGPGDELQSAQFTSRTHWTRLVPALASGQYRVVIASEGFATEERTVTLGGGRVESLEVRLHRN